MPRPKPTRPTDFEFAIMQFLWKEGDSTIRTVWDNLKSARPALGRTTVSKIMEVMIGKMLLKRAGTSHSYLYRPRPSRKQIERQFVQDLIRCGFSGSTSAFVKQAL